MLRASAASTDHAGNPRQMGFNEVSSIDRRTRANAMRGRHSKIWALKALHPWQSRDIPFETLKASSPELDTVILEEKLSYAVASFVEYANRAACQSADPERRARALARKFGRRWKMRAAALACARRVAERSGTQEDKAPQKEERSLPTPRGASDRRAKRPSVLTTLDASFTPPQDSSPSAAHHQAQDVLAPATVLHPLSMRDLSMMRRRSTPGHFATHYAFFEENNNTPDGTPSHRRRASRQKVANLGLAVLPQVEGRSRSEPLWGA